MANYVTITHELGDEISITTTRFDDDDGPILELGIYSKGAEIKLRIRDPQQARALTDELTTIWILLDAALADPVIEAEEVRPLDRRSGDDRRNVQIGCLRRRSGLDRRKEDAALADPVIEGEEVESLARRSGDDRRILNTYSDCRREGGNPGRRKEDKE